MTATISAVNGGTPATGADNNSYTLTIPPNALTNDLAITMTPLSSATGLPITGGALSAGVQFAPEGLALLQPATLVITPSTPIPAGSNLVPVGWTGSGQDAILAPIVVDPSQLAISILHFSGAGVAGGTPISPGDAGAVANSYGNEADNYSNQISQILDQEQQAETSGQPGNPDWQQQVLALLNQYYEQVIDPLLETAIESGDPTLLNCAIQKALSWEKSARAFGGTGNTLQNSPAFGNLVKAAKAVVQIMQSRCDQHDPTAATLLIAAYRSYALLSNDSSGEPAIVQEIQKCSPTFELDFNSQISGGGPTTGMYNAVVAAKGIVDARPLGRSHTAKPADGRRYRTTELHQFFRGSGSLAGTLHAIRIAGDRIDFQCLSATRDLLFWHLLRRESEHRRGSGSGCGHGWQGCVLPDGSAAGQSDPCKHAYRSRQAD